MPKIPFRLSRQRRLRTTPTTATSHQPAHGRNARTTSTGQTLVAGGTRQVRAASLAKPARQAVTGTVRAGAHTLPPAKKTRGTVPGAVKPKKRTRALGQMRRSIGNDRAQHTNQPANPSGRCRPHRVRAQDFDAPLNRSTGPDAQREAMRAADHATTDRETAEITRRQRAQAHKEQADKRRYLNDFLTDPDSITSRRTPPPPEPAPKRKARKRPDPAAEKRRQRREINAAHAHQRRNTDPEHTDQHPGRGRRRRGNTPTVTPTTGSERRRSRSRSNPRAAAVDRRARRHQTAKQERAARQQAAQEAAQQRRQERQAAEQRRRAERRKVTAARRR